MVYGSIHLKMELKIKKMNLNSLGLYKVGYSQPVMAYMPWIMENTRGHTHLLVFLSSYFDIFIIYRDWIGLIDIYIP